MFKVRCSTLRSLRYHVKNGLSRKSSLLKPNNAQSSRHAALPRKPYGRSPEGGGRSWKVVEGAGRLWCRTHNSTTPRLGNQLAQDVGKDAAVLVVVDLDGSIYAAGDGDRAGLAIGAADAE